MIPAIDSEFNVDKTDSEKEGLRVKIRYLKNLIDSPLLISDIKNRPIISEDRSLINGLQSATVALSKNAFDEIIKILGNDDQIFSNIRPETADTIDEISNLELKYLNASPQVSQVISSRIERGKLSSIIKELNNYKCQVCEVLGQNPHSFKKANGEYYVETHHINPVSNLTLGSLTFSNLITVCATHHRQFHYGDILQIDTKEYLTINIGGKIFRIEKNRY